MAGLLLRWHDKTELGPVVLKKIGEHTGLTPNDL